MVSLSPLARLRLKVDLFNVKHPVGTPVYFWTSVLEGAGTAGKTSRPAEMLGGETPVVWVEGRTDPIPLTHIKIVETRTRRGA